MANNVAITVGTPPVEVLHPGVALQDARRNRTPTSFYGRVNSYTNPLGMEPGVAWLLMKTSVVNSLGKNALHPIRFHAGTSFLNTGSIFTVVRSHAMDFAVAGVGTAKRVVELHDVRRLLNLSSINSQYNVRQPAPAATSGATLYYDDSLDTGSVWTWQTLLTDVWGNLPAVAGTAPTLPYTPDGTPENWRFLGVTAWEALHQVLAKVGCSTSLNPQAGVFSYVRLGTTQSGLANTLSSLSNRLMFDYDPGESYALANIPEKVRVHFRRREEYHGIEKDSPDTAQWEMTPIVSKDHATGVTGAQTGSFVNVWDDLPALFDETDANSNAAALQTRADEVGANVEAALVNESDGLRRLYSGLVTDINPGAEVFSVSYRDYGDGNGLVTEIARGPLTPVATGVEPPSLNDANFPPTWPRVHQIVQVDQGSGDPGDTVNPNSDEVFPGNVLRCVGDPLAYEVLEPCWIYPMDLSGVDETAEVNLLQKDRYHGRLMGNFDGDSMGDIRPLYLVRQGPAGSAYNWDITADDPTGPFTIASGDTIDLDATDQDFTTEANGTKADRGLVVEVTDSGTTTTAHFAIDKSPIQSVAFTGGFTGTAQGKQGTRNQITFFGNTGNPPPIDMTADAAGLVDVEPNNPMHTVEGDTGSEDLDFRDTLILTGGAGASFAVTKSVNDVTATLSVTAGLPIGAVVMGVLKPIKDGANWYLDRGGVADTDWALMDGTSNSGGSGVQMATGAAGTAVEHFVRGKSHDGTTPVDAADGAIGRNSDSASTGGLDEDEVIVGMDDHTDHEHTITTDTCDNDTSGPNAEEYQFGTQNPQTSAVTAVGGGAATSGILGHTADLTNHQGVTGDDIEMLPSHQKLYFFERVAFT